MSNREYERWYGKLVRRGYTLGAAHQRATAIVKLQTNKRSQTLTSIIEKGNLTPCRHPSP